MSQEKWQGPVYDLMLAYSQLTYGNIFPRVMAGYAARKWVHDYARKHSSFPHCEDRYGETIIERGDVAEDTFKFFLDDDVKEMIMHGYQERMGHIFEDHVPPPNLEAILVKVPIPEEEKFRYVYTGPGGIDPQTAEEAEALENKDEMRDLRQGSDGRRNNIPGQ